jgi:hypothetical protein
MTVRGRLSWRGVVILAGASYGFIGIVFGLPSTHVRIWRLAAWAVSGVVYISHLAYERYWLGARPLTTATHVAMAVAIGAFLLAVGATVHAAMVSSHAPYWRFGLALILWPIITAAPAFVVALVQALVLSQLPINRLRS